MALAASVISVASAQSFVNGNFETGDFTGWTIANTVNGTSRSNTVVQYDIDGPGAHSTSFVGRFQVGQVTFQSGFFAA